MDEVYYEKRTNCLLYGYILFVLLIFLSLSSAVAENNPVAVVIGGERISRNDLAEEIADYEKFGTFQEKLLTLTPEGKREILNRLVKERLLYQAAVDEGITIDPEAARRIERLKREFIVKQYVQAIIDKNKMKDGELYDFYLKHLEEFSEPEKRKIRHILVKTQEEAQGLLERLKAGESFEILATEHNIDETRNRGGDLGWIERGVMVLEFEETAFSLSKGAVSNAVNTSFGCHIIRVEEIKSKVQKGFGEVKQQVKTMAEQEILLKLEMDLRDKYGVKIFENALGDSRK